MRAKSITVHVLASMAALAPLAMAQDTPSVWNFESPFVEGILLASEGPGSIEFFEGPLGFTAAATQFGKASAFGLPGIDGADVDVMAWSPDSFCLEGYIVFHETGANGGGEFVNQYTLVYDIYVPESSFFAGPWMSFFQTAADNCNDGDLFIRTSDGGIGISGIYDGRIVPNTWHRVAFVFDLTRSNDRLKKYIDGTLVGEQSISGVDGRWSLFTADDPATPWFFLFSDEDNEQEEGYVSSFFYTDRPLSDSEIAALGSPTADGIRIDPIAPCYADFDGDGELTIFDFLAFQNAFASGDLAADCDDDGSLTLFDFLCFQNAFAQGCP